MLRVLFIATALLVPSIAFATPVGPVEMQQLPDCGDASGQHLNYSATTGAFTCGDTTPSTSIGLSMPGIFSVTGAPVTGGTGTLTVTLQSQAPGLFLASPAGSAGPPAMRSITNSDLPAPTLSGLGGVQAIGQTAHEWVSYIDTSGIPHLAQPAAADLSNGTTGSGSVVLSTSPTLTTPNLGTPSSLVLTNATGLPLTSGVTGVLPTANLPIGTAGAFLPLLNGANTWSGANTFSAVATFNAGLVLNYTSAGVPAQFGEVDSNGSFTWPDNTVNGCCRLRYWSDTVTLSGSPANSNVLELNFFNLIFAGTATLTNEAFNIVHPYAYLNSGLTISGYAENFEASDLNDGTISGFLNGYLATFTNGAGTTQEYIAFRALASNNNAAAGSFANYVGYECDAFGGTGTAPSVSSNCLVNRDSTQGILTAGGLTIGSFSSAPTPGQLNIIGPDTSGNTYPIIARNAAGANIIFDLADSGALSLPYGFFQLGSAGQWSKLILYNPGTGSLQLSPPSSGTLSGTVVLPNASTTLAGLSVAETFTALQTFSGNLLVSPVATASLPTCNSGAKGERGTVTDATSPTFGGSLTGGGAVVASAFCNGSTWVTE